jgi:copper resistance protein C
MRRTLLVVAALLAVLLPGTPAWAHTTLVSCDPAEDATLGKAPTEVTLVFSRKLKPDFATIVLSDAAAQRIPASTPAVDDVNGTITVGRPLGNGVYTVAYRVVSLDGHTVQGAYPFVVADPALPAAPAAGRPAQAAPPPAGSALAPIGLTVAGVLLAGLAAYFSGSGRRRATRTGSQGKAP